MPRDPSHGWKPSFDVDRRALIGSAVLAARQFAVAAGLLAALYAVGAPPALLGAAPIVAGAWSTGRARTLVTLLGAACLLGCHAMGWPVEVGALGAAALLSTGRPHALLGAPVARVGGLLVHALLLAPVALVAGSLVHRPLLAAADLLSAHTYAASAEAHRAAALTLGFVALSLLPTLLSAVRVRVSDRIPRPAEIDARLPAPWSAAAHAAWSTVTLLPPAMRPAVAPLAAEVFRLSARVHTVDNALPPPTAPAPHERPDAHDHDHRHHRHPHRLNAPHRPDAPDLRDLRDLRDTLSHRRDRALAALRAEVLRRLPD